MFNQAQALKQYLQCRQDTIEKERVRDLFNDRNFYQALIKDMLEAKKEVIIYSPFVSKFRTDFLRPTLERLIERNIEVFIFTRPLEEYDAVLRPQIACALSRYEKLGINIYYQGRYIHEKVAIIDREILWEGSLNILSHRSSREMMRRISGEISAIEVMNYLELNNKIAESYKKRYEKLCRNLVSSKNIKANARVFCLVFAAATTLCCLIIGIGGMISLFRWVEPILKLIFNHQ